MAAPKINVTLGTLFRIMAGIGPLVQKVNLAIADGKITGNEIVDLLTDIIELISGKSLDELGIVVDLS